MDYCWTEVRGWEEEGLAGGEKEGKVKMRVACSRLGSSPRLTAIKRSLCPELSKQHHAWDLVASYEPGEIHGRARQRPGQDFLQEGWVSLVHTLIVLFTFLSWNHEPKQLWFSKSQQFALLVQHSSCLYQCHSKQGTGMANMHSALSWLGTETERSTEQSAEHKTPYLAVAQFHSPEQILLPWASQSHFCLVWGITAALLPLQCSAHCKWCGGRDAAQQ